DGSKQFLFRGQLSLAFGSDLAYKYRTRLHLSADPDDSRIVQVSQRRFGNVRNVASNFLGPEFGVARFDFKLLDVNLGERVFFHQLLGHQNRVLKVVPAPWHKRDQHIPPESEFALIGARAIGDDIALLYRLTFSDYRLLIDAGVLVRPLELRKLIDVGVDFPRCRSAGDPVLRTDDNSLRVNRVDHAVAAGNYDCSGILRRDFLHAGPHQRRFGAQQRD